MRARWRYEFTDPLLSDMARPITRSLNPLSNFKRRTSRIFRIDDISVGMDPSLLDEGP